MSGYNVGSIYGTMSLKMGQWAQGVKRIQRDTRTMKMQARDAAKAWGDVGKQLSKIGAVGSVVGGFVGRSFVQAASATEQYQVRLNALLGSQEEGNRLFEEMTRFASQVPFEYEQIMAGATQLSGIMKGGVDQVAAWMPMIADLAAVSGLSIQETTGQVVRMYSAGAGAADLFRERGITAMLGFTAGVSYSADETRQRLVEAFEDPLSQFRGAANDLANTWTGQLSMMSDKWFNFRNRVMNVGIFASLKNALKAINSYLDENQEAVDRWLDKHGAAITNAVIGTAAIAGLSAAMGGLAFVVAPLIKTFSLFNKAIARTVQILLGGAIVISGPLIGAFLLLGGSLYALRAQWDEVWNGAAILVGDTANYMGEAFGNAFDWIVEKATWYTKTLIGQHIKLGQVVKRTLTGDFAGAWDAVWSKGADAYDQMVEDMLDTTKSSGKEFVGALFGGGGDSEIDGTIFSSVLDQMKKDFGELKKFIATQSPELASQMDSISAILSGAAVTDEEVAQALSGIDVGALLSGGPAGEATGGAGGKNLAEAGRSLWESLKPPEGLFSAAIQGLKELNAAGKLTPEAMALFGGKLFNDFSEMSRADFEAVTARLQDFGSDAGQVAAGIIDAFMGAKQAAQDEELATLVERISPATSILTDLQTEVALLEQAGQIDQYGNLLGQYYFQQYGDSAREVFQTVQQGVADAGGSVQAGFIKAQEEATKNKDKWREMGSAIQDTGHKLAEVGNTIKSTIGRKLGAAVSSIGGIVGGLGQARKAFKSMGDSGKQGAGQALQAVMGMATGVLGAISAVASLAEAFGLFGDESEEELTGMSKVMEDIAEASSAWVDRLADDLLEFVKTGKLAVGELAQYIADELFKIGITELVLNPAVGALGGLLGFAKGGAFENGEVTAFARGGVVSHPMIFPMAKGLGLMGEAGPEAVMPLTRLPNGDLGVKSLNQSKGSHVVINDMRQGGEDVQVEQHDDGTVEVYIRDIVSDMIQTGDFNQAMSQQFGMGGRPIR